MCQAPHYNRPRQRESVMERDREWETEGDNCKKQAVVSTDTTDNIYVPSYDLYGNA